MRAYETLVIEGYAETRPASGIFAAAVLPQRRRPRRRASRRRRLCDARTAPASGITAPAGIGAPARQHLVRFLAGRPRRLRCFR